MMKSVFRFVMASGRIIARAAKKGGGVEIGDGFRDWGSKKLGIEMVAWNEAGHLLASGGGRKGG